METGHLLNYLRRNVKSDIAGITVGRVPQPDDDPATRVDIEATALAFSRRHQLKGVMLIGDTGTAMIDRDMVDVGEVFDGATLIRVTGSEAHFQCSDGVAVLNVAQ